MGNPFFQDLDPSGAPDPVTPADGPGDQSGYSGVSPSGTGAAPAPYDISAPQDIAGITASFDAANALSGAGVLYAQSPRQSQTEALLDSPQGAGEYNITAGFGDYEPTDPDPGPNMENPIQGHTGEYPGTMQDGVPQYGGNEGGPVPVDPSAGTMAGSQGGDYPGTTQSGLTKYGTS